MSQLLLLVSSTRSMTTRMHSIQLVDRCSANHNVQVHDLERWTPGCTCSGPELLLRCGRTGQVGKRIQSLPKKPTRKPRSRSACGPQARRFHPYPSGPGLRPQVSTPDSIQMSMWKARSMDALAQSPLPSRWRPSFCGLCARNTLTGAVTAFLGLTSVRRSFPVVRSGNRSSIVTAATGNATGGSHRSTYSSSP